MYWYMYLIINGAMPRLNALSYVDKTMCSVWAGFNVQCCTKCAVMNENVQ